jgi:hypothetical protein
VNIYVIGSLRNPDVPVVAQALRADGHEVFSSWFCAGPEADDNWQKHEQGRGLTYIEALKDYAAQNVYLFDRRHLERADVGVLVYPAGKSAHLELGWLLGQGKRGFIYMPQEPERWDVMLAFADGISATLEDLRYRLSLMRRRDGKPVRANYDANGMEVS